MTCVSWCCLQVWCLLGKDVALIIHLAVLLQLILLRDLPASMLINYLLFHMSVILINSIWVHDSLSLSMKVFLIDLSHRNKMSLASFLCSRRWHLDRILDLLAWLCWDDMTWLFSPLISLAMAWRRDAVLTFFSKSSFKGEVCKGKSSPERVKHWLQLLSYYLCLELLS